MNIALMRQQLRGRDVLQGDRIVLGIGDDGVAVHVVMRRRQQGAYACKHCMVDLYCIGCRQHCWSLWFWHYSKENDWPRVGDIAGRPYCPGAVDTPVCSQGSRGAGIPMLIYWVGGEFHFDPPNS